MQGRPNTLAGLVFFCSAASGDEVRAMWKRIAAFLAALAMLIAVSGCGGDREPGKYKNQDKPKSTEEQ
jgi:hypothetical protein